MNNFWIVISDRHAIYWQAEIFDRKESNSKVLFLSSTSRCRKRTSRKYKKSNMFIPVHHRNIYKSNFHNRSTFHPLPHVKIPLPQEGFPPKNPSSEATAIFVRRIHFRLGLDEPLDDRLVALRGCIVQRCDTSGCCGPMAQAPQAEPNGTEGEKNFEKILAPQKSKFWKLWPLQLLTKVKKHCCFEMS